MCNEALCIAENIIHPRLPVVGVEALSQCVTDKHLQAHDMDVEPPGFVHRLDLGFSGERNEFQLNRDDDVHSTSDTVPCGVVSEASRGLPLLATESSITDERTELSVPDVSLPDEERAREFLDIAEVADVDNQVDMTSPTSGQELDKSDSLSLISAASSFAVSPNLTALSRAVLSPVREDAADDQAVETPTDSAAVPSSESDVMKEKSPDRSHSEPQQSSHKRRHSTASSANGDSESEGGEIEV